MGVRDRGPEYKCTPHFEDCISTKKQNKKTKLFVCLVKPDWDEGGNLLILFEGTVNPTGEKKKVTTKIRPTAPDSRISELISRSDMGIFQ